MLKSDITHRQCFKTTSTWWSTSSFLAHLHHFYWLLQHRYNSTSCWWEVTFARTRSLLGKFAPVCVSLCFAQVFEMYKQHQRVHMCFRMSRWSGPQHGFFCLNALSFSLNIWSLSVLCHQARHDLQQAEENTSGPPVPADPGVRQDEGLSPHGAGAELRREPSALQLRAGLAAQADQRGRPGDLRFT